MRAQEIRKCAAFVDGVDAKHWQVPEMLQEHVPKSDAPLITPRHLAEADGGLNNLLVIQPESSTALGLKVLVKKPPRKFLLSIQNNTSLKTLALVFTCVVDMP
ncbi:hypothetical protein F2Q68_00006502 [Brassica cretica]|uniref:Uncharacterized protein n=1 Tax=Brassica cretica TaxID=69181 RepID=A0A8S9JKZ2_BRACR|nr:hypothetical protein F2Q68_00006502 [Brassica cretica]